MGYMGVALCIMMSQTCGGLESKRLDGSCLVGGMMELNEKHTLKHASMWWWVMRLKESVIVMTFWYVFIGTDLTFSNFLNFIFGIDHDPPCSLCSHDLCFILHMITWPREVIIVL